EQAQRSPAQNVSLLGLLQFFADQGRAFEPDLYGSVAAAFEPLDQRSNLRRTPRTVGALDDDQLAGQLGQIHAGNSVAVIAAFGGSRNEDMIWAGSFHSTNCGCLKRLA